MTSVFQRWLAGIVSLAVLLSGSLVSPTPAVAKPWEPPKPQEFPVTLVQSASGKAKAVDTVKSGPAKRVVWPEARQVTLTMAPDGRSRRAGALPVWVGTPKGADRVAGSVTVRMLDKDTSQKLVGVGVVFAVEALAGSDLRTTLGYADFEGLSGGDFGGRLTLGVLPTCALSTPEAPECRQIAAVESENDTQRRQVSAQLRIPSTEGAAAASTMVMAATASSSGDQNDFTATSLKGADTWSGGGSSGQFTWSYPLRTPPVPGGLAPLLSIDYASGRTDGAVSSTNNQSSWVGEGFDLSLGFIERKYIPCRDESSNNTSTKTGDLCWVRETGVNNDEPWDNATLSLPGHGGELVRVGSTAQWRLKDDDGTRVDKIGATGSTGEYWRATTTDGTQYFFGKGKADGSTTATNSKWSVPVFSNNNAGTGYKAEPDYSSTYSSSWKSRAWRWNLDYVVSPTSDSMTLYYTKEQNQYARNLATKTTYDRGGWLNRIEYGQRKGVESTAASAKVAFVVKERCDVTKKPTCESETTSFTPSAWPDVPLDAICTTSPVYCPSVKASPTFFTRKRLAQLNTSIIDAGGAYDAVDTWDLTASFPATGDTVSDPTLWPASIKHTGQDGTSATPAPLSLPVTTLTPVSMHNRVTGSTGTYGLMRPRLQRVTSPLGGRTDVTYSAEDCTPATVPSNPATNTTRCFPVYYASGSATPTLHWFTKYVVATVEEIDVTEPGQPALAEVDLSDREVTNYTYVGGAGWHYENSPLTKKKFRTWNGWRGYETVVTTVGTGSTKTITEGRYFRGMDGDWLDSTGTNTKSVKVSDSNGTQMSDSAVFVGQQRESRNLTAVGGSTTEQTLNEPVVVATTADDGKTKATLIDTKITRSKQWVSGGTRQSTATTKAWDAWGQPTLSEDTGDEAVTGDETCSVTSYAAPTGASLIVDHVSESWTYPGLCDGPRTIDTALTGSRAFYDNLANGVGTAGLVTKSETLAGAAPRTWRTSSLEYDIHGRPTKKTDALNRVSTASYTPAVGRPVTSSQSTSADPDGAGPLTAHVATTTYDPRWGTTIKQVQAAGQTTESQLDALGRVAAVWEPGRSRTATASSTFSYAVNQAGINATTTRTLLPNGVDYRTAVEILDSLGRSRQTQTQTLQGSQVADTLYTSRGLVGVNDSYLVSVTPSTTLLLVGTRSGIPSSTRTYYDHAQRATASAFLVDEVEKWRTTSTYTGDAVTVTPPQGATATTTVSDLHGRTTRLTQHLADGTSSTTTYAYSPAGLLEKMTDPKGNEWKYTYDVQGNKLTADDPDKGRSTMTYDIVGNLLTSTDARNRGTSTPSRSGAAAPAPPASMGNRPSPAPRGTA